MKTLTAARATLAACTLAALAGCTSFGVPSFAMPQLDVPLQTVTITLEKSGKPIEMRADQELVVRLLSETATNYEWRLATNDTGILKPSAPYKFERQDLNKNEFENAGYEIWRFKPTGPGRQTLHYEYRRPRAREAVPAQDVTFDITVR
ncbi:hypothetical protein BH11PSE8_BH11PSE8_12000 [soil metagenome]